MRIGKTILDLENLTEEDLTEVIREAKHLRIRKIEARNLNDSFSSLLKSAKENNFDICNKYTGEVLQTEDWVIYDRELQQLSIGEWSH